MKLHPLPAFADNCIWLLQSEQQALVVDPGDAQPILDFLHTRDQQRAGILINHHLADITGGVDRLCDEAFAPVLGPPIEKIPGHSAGHVVYGCLTLRAAGLAPLSASMGLERTINPFLRSEAAAVIASVTPV